MENEDELQIPWLERIDKPEDEKTEIERVEYLTMLEELEYK